MHLQAPNKIFGGKYIYKKTKPAVSTVRETTGLCSELLTQMLTPV